MELQIFFGICDLFVEFVVAIRRKEKILDHQIVTFCLGVGIEMGLEPVPVSKEIINFSNGFVVKAKIAFNNFEIFKVKLGVENQVLQA